MNKIGTQLPETAAPVLEEFILRVSGTSVVGLHHDIGTISGEEFLVFILTHPPRLREARKERTKYLSPASGMLAAGSSIASVSECFLGAGSLQGMTDVLLRRRPDRRRCIAPDQYHNRPVSVVDKLAAAINRAAQVRAHRGDS